MPGRKCHKNTRRNSEDAEYRQRCLFAQAASVQFQSMAKELELMRDRHVQTIKKYIALSLAQFPSHVLNMTLEELEAADKQNKKSLKDNENTCASSDFEETRGRNMAFTFRSRSPTPVLRKQPVPVVQGSRRSSSHNSYFRNKLCHTKVTATPITAKVNPGSPVGMLRYPADGEFAVSASGSPLLVSSHYTGRANISIPLNNGKVVSVMPTPGINTDPIIGNLAPDIRRQLGTLTDTLSAILKSYDHSDNK